MPIRPLPSVSTTPARWLAALAVAVALTTGGAEASVGSWSSTGPSAATVRAVAFDPSSTQRVYLAVATRAADSSGLVYKSADGGTSWVASNQGLPDVAVQAIAIDPKTPTTVWVGTDGAGMYRSTDAGASWTSRSTGLDVPFVRGIAIDPVTTTTLWAATDLSVYKSTDGGASWSVAADASDGLLLELEVNAIVVNPSSPSTVYAGTGEGVYKTANGGSSWALMANTDLRNITSLAIDPATPTTLYSTDDNGNVYRIKQGSNWAQKNSGFGSYPGANVIVLDPSNPSTAYVGSDDGVWKATDAAGSLTWVSVKSGFPNATNLSAVAVQPGGQVILAGDNFGDGVFRSTNASTSWVRSNSGLNATDIGTVAIDPAAPSGVGGAVASTFFAGVFGSQDAGNSWTRNQVAHYVKPLAIAIDPTNTGVRYAGLDFQNGVWKSTDSGVTWTTTGFTWSPVRAMAIDPAAHTTIYAATDAGVQKTTDGGTTWAAVNSGLTGLDVRALVAHPTLANTLYAGTTVGVFATSNGGTSWSALGTGLSSTDVRALLLDTRSNPAVLWAGSTGGLARLSLGSSSWSDASSGLSFPDVRALALDRSGTIYAGTFGGGVFQRATSSSTWSAMNTGLPVLRVTSLAWDPRGAGTLYAGTQGRGVQTITIPQSACGDGTLQAGEQCDDGNTTSGDCCSATCAIEASGTICRAAAGTCDVAETCNGTSGTCPADAIVAAGTTCRIAAGACDAVESCDGSAKTCPSDSKLAAGTQCRTAAGVCDLAESCTGSSNDCPVDAFATAATQCRAANGACDVAERCDGNSGVCPVDTAAADGTACSDGSACTQVDTCSAGTCVGSNPVVCTASDPCHDAGLCDPSSGTCSDPAKPDLATCDDGDACTAADACQAGVCRGTPVLACTGLDAFTCYKASSARVSPPVAAFASRTIAANDFFRAALATSDLGVQLSKPAALCNPSDVYGAATGATGHAAHGEAYAARALKAPFTTLTRTVSNRLGVLKLAVGKLSWIFAPSSTAPGTGGADPLLEGSLTPFSCYAVSVARLTGNVFVRTQATVTDVLGGPLTYDLLKPVRLCVAADLDGGTPVAPVGAATLACYQAKLARLSPAQPRFLRQDVSAQNLFGSEVLSLIGPQEICLPTELLD